MLPKSYRSPKTKVLKSSKHGYGLFAVRSIRIGEIVTIKGGHIVDRKTLKKFEKVIRGSELQIDDNFYLAPLQKEEVEGVMMFLNHSCSPNVGISGNITFVTMRDIKKGEELTIDYAMIDDSTYKMRCRCGSTNCRKIVTGKDWKRLELKKKYQGYFSAFLKRKIK